MNIFNLNYVWRIAPKKVMVIFYFVMQNYCYFSQSGDSLQIALKSANHDTLKCDILSGWGESIYQDQPDSAKTIWLQALAIAEKNYNSTQDEFLKKAFGLRAASALNNLAAIYLFRGDWQLVEDYTLRSIKLREMYSDKEGVANCLNNLGYMYTKQGNLASAMDSYFKCLRISEEINDKAGMGFSYLNIGSAFYRQGENEEALNYFKKALKVREELNDQKGIATALTNIGVIYDSKKDYDNSLKMYFRVLKIYEELGRKKGIAETYNNIGTVYNTRNENSEALKYYEMALRLHQEIKNESGQARVLADLSKVYLKKGDFTKSLELAEKSLVLSQKTGQIEYIKDASEQLKELYKQNGNLKMAFKMFEIFEQAKDSINNEKTKKASIRTQFQYEFDKKEALLEEEQKQQQLLAAEKNRQQKIILWSVILGLLIVGVFLLIIYSRLRVTRQQKIVIDKKNVENEVLLTEIHHRVKNNLQVISSLLSLQERSMESGSAKSAIHEGKERIKSMELVHKLLYQKGSFTGIEMKEYVTKLLDGLLESFGLEKDSIDLNIDVENLTLDVDTAVPIGLILNELIVNTFKHNKNLNKKPLLSLNLCEMNNQLKLELGDNGLGKASEVQNSNSFGMKVVNALVRQLNGILKVSDENGLNFTLVFNNYKLIKHGN